MSSQHGDDDAYSEDFEDYEEDFEDFEEEEQEAKEVIAENTEASQQHARQQNTGQSSRSSGSSTRVRRRQEQDPNSLLYKNSEDIQDNEEDLKRTSYPYYEEDENKQPETETKTQKSSPTGAWHVKQYVQASNKKVQYLKAIKQSVKFVEEGGETFIQQPLQDLEMYMQHLRAGNLRESAQDTGEGRTTVDIQTEPTTLTEKSCQVPDDIGVTMQDGTGSKDSTGWKAWKNLVPFLRKVSPVMEQMCEENELEIDIHKSQNVLSPELYEHESAADFRIVANASMPIPTRKRAVAEMDKLVKDRDVVTTASCAQSGYVAVAYKPIQSSSPGSNQSQASPSKGVLGASSALSESIQSGSAQILSQHTLSLYGVILVYHSRSIINGYNENEHVGPTRVLIVPETPTCLMFGPGKGDVVVAGTEAGTVCLWDLNESAFLHHVIIPGINDFATVGFSNNSRLASPFGVESGLRFPTYSTDAAIGSLANDSTSEAEPQTEHYGPVFKLLLLSQSSQHSYGRKVSNEQSSRFDPNEGIAALVLNDEENDKAFAGAASEGSSTFQFASVDEFGVIKVWTSVEIPVPQDPNTSSALHEDAIYESDLGLRPGGRIRLINSSTVTCGLSSAELTGRQHISDATVCNEDPSKLIASSYSGNLIQVNRFGTSVEPRFFSYPFPEDCTLTEAASALCDPALCIDYCPRQTGLFSVGYQSGKVALFSVKSASCLTTWHVTSSPIIELRWTPGRRTVFLALDSNNSVHMFDLYRQQNAYIGAVSLSTTFSSMPSEHCPGENPYAVHFDFVDSGLIIQCREGVILAEGMQRDDGSSQKLNASDWLSKLTTDWHGKSVDIDEPLKMKETEAEEAAVSLNP